MMNGSIGNLRYRSCGPSSGVELDSQATVLCAGPLKSHAYCSSQSTVRVAHCAIPDVLTADKSKTIWLSVLNGEVCLDLGRVVVARFLTLICLAT